MQQSTQPILPNGINEELEQIQAVYEIIVNFFVNYSFQILGALLIMMLGMFVANKVSKVILKLCVSKNIDITLSRFIANIVRILVIAMVAIISLSKLGISVTPFLAAIGALSLGAGLALQTLLSNYGAGLNIILTRPFVVGDTISIKGESGIVKDILLAYTVIVTEDDVEITIPNKHIVGEILHNSHEVSLLELSVGVSYDSDIDHVTSILTDTISTHQDASDLKKAQVGISGFGDSSVDFEIRVWVESNKINAAKFALNKAIWDILQQHKITIPYPQREVQLLASTIPAL